MKHWKVFIKQDITILKQDKTIQDLKFDIGMKDLEIDLLKTIISEFEDMTKETKGNKK